MMRINMAALQLSTVLLLLLLLFISGSETVYNHRIIGGQVVMPYSIKYQASLQYGNRRHFCGGTLVHPQWVLSAAHCWRPSTLMKVVLSEHNLYVTEGYEQVFNVEKIFVHNYNRGTFNNDIMLIKLSRPALLNANVQPATLPDPNAPPLTSNSCTVSGWGVTKLWSYHLSPELRAVDVNIRPACSRYGGYWSRITPNMLCAGAVRGGKDSCQGDSGGPLMCDRKLEGIVSWGISCANPYYPGVYTRVRKYTQWIKWVINNR